MISAAVARRRYLGLLALRWLPVGLTIPVSVLILTQRGLSLGQVGLAVSAQGLVVFALELPTGGLADAIGRRPVLTVATAIDAMALVAFLVARNPSLLLGVYAAKGVSRALDSGPLEAWFVDAALVDDPDADYETTLAHGASVLSAAIAVGALASGGLVALGDLGPVHGLSVPVVAAVLADVVAVGALRRWMVEPRAERGRAALATGVRDVPRHVRTALHAVRTSRLLVSLVAVEVLWCFGMAAFELLMSPRLAEVLDSSHRAAAVFGPVTSAAWVASAVGAAAVPSLARRIGARRAGAVLRLGHGLTVGAMALAAGPIGLVVAYTLSYTVHGAANPVHQGLLHREVRGPERVTVLSVNSMVGRPAAALGGVLLGSVADAAGIPTAMAIGAVVLAAAAPLYLVGREQRPPDPLTPPRPTSSGLAGAER
ncbi:hypothetical protein BH10ACT1_BH10ACT1_18140 [soil metagenome]